VNGLTETKVTVECRDPRGYRACYKPAREKINQCIPRRGDTIQKMHDTIYNQFCMDEGGTIFNGVFQISEFLIRLYKTNP
jgi:hypothetical protein